MVCDSHSIDDNQAQSVANLEAKLSQCEEQLARSKSDLVDFASIVAHDLRSPLLTISGYADLLCYEYEGKLDDTAKHYLRSIVDGVGRVNRLIEDLSRFAQWRCMECQTDTVELERVMADVLGNLEDAIHQKAATIRIESLPCIKGCHSDFVHLFQNLIDNAIKFHGTEPPVISVSSSRGSGGIVIRVTDNGIGIDPKHHESVFRILHRLPVSKNLPGSGIGLAICKKIVECYHGRIWIESQPDQGSTFCIWLADKEPNQS